MINDDDFHELASAFFFKREEYKSKVSSGEDVSDVIIELDEVREKFEEMLYLVQLQVLNKKE